MSAPAQSITLLVIAPAASTPTPTPTPTPSPSPSATPLPPIIYTEQGSQRALALDSVTWLRDPVTANNANNFSTDHRTRIMLLAGNINLNAGETYSIVSAQGQDAQGANYPLEVEFAGRVPGYDWLTQIIIRVPDQWIGAGDLSITMSLRGVASNRAFVTIKQ